MQYRTLSKLEEKIQQLKRLFEVDKNTVEYIIQLNSKPMELKPTNEN